MTEPKKKGLTAEQIDAAGDLERVAVEVPEWGGTVYVQQIACADLDTFLELQDAAGTGRFKLRDMCRLVALSLVNEDGERLYSDEAAARLGRRNSKLIERLFFKGLEVSGMTKAGIEAEKKG